MSQSTEPTAAAVLLPPVATWAVDEVGTPICPICANAGGKYLRPEGYPPECKLPDVWHLCQCQRDMNRRSAMRKAGVPRQYLEFTREHWEANIGPWGQGLLRGLESWPPRICSSADWLVAIYGKFGRGKTSLATALLGEALRKSRTAKWIDCNDWIDAMEAAMAEPGGQAREYLAVRDVPVLVLDDLGAIRGGRTAAKAESRSWWREKVASLLRHREMQLMPTVITSNLVKPAVGVAEHETWPAGLALFDRSLISRCNVPLAIELGGPDRRTIRRQELNP